MEADFRRKYGISLVREIGSMSWREFQVLLRGLGVWSQVAAAAAGGVSGPSQRVIDDPVAAERAVERLLG